MPSIIIQRNIIITLSWLLLVSLSFQTEAVLLATSMTINQSTSLNSIRVSGNQKNKIHPRLTLNSGSKSATRIENKGDFLLLSKDKQPLMTLSSVHVQTKANTEFSQGINIQKDYVVRGKRQWMLAYRSELQEFDSKYKTECGIYKLLGGHCVSGSRPINHHIVLPKHSFVRVKLSYHFIDSW